MRGLVETARQQGRNRPAALAGWPAVPSPHRSLARFGGRCFHTHQQAARACDFAALNLADGVLPAHNGCFETVHRILREWTCDAADRICSWGPGTGGGRGGLLPGTAR